MRFVNVNRVLLILVFVSIIILYVVLPCTALFMVNYSPLGRNFRFCCRRFGWQLGWFFVSFCLAYWWMFSYILFEQYSGCSAVNCIISWRAIEFARGFCYICPAVIFFRKVILLFCWMPLVQSDGDKSLPLNNYQSTFSCFRTLTYIAYCTS